ncbi:toMV resistant protein Tm-2 netted virescent-like [Quercus robur]|uniref:toMV resistant protein Tm-2 netted virescent-like n=1 Tax=Quercus robur TaxID=38942 RepID=UPI00216317EA|nr:toMV resistant protein Tm-2 netted virescent-like [Quercus robur]
MAESVVKLVIQHLIRLLSQEASLLEGIHKKVANIKDKLESIHSFLKDADARAKMGDMNNIAITWVKQRQVIASKVQDNLKVIRKRDNDKGSRIVITTRSEDVAPSVNESPHYYVYKLPPLPLEKALELFCKKVFQCERSKCPSDLADLSHGIVERCGGLPLAIVAIGGLLSS